MKDAYALPIYTRTWSAQTRNKLVSAGEDKRNLGEKVREDLENMGVKVREDMENMGGKRNLREVL